MIKSLSLLAFSLGLVTSASCASGNYQQCGGTDFQGSTSCTDGWQCLCQSQWYSQCLPPSQPVPAGWNRAGCKSSGSSPAPATSSPKPNATPSPPSNPSTGSTNSEGSDAGGSSSGNASPGSCGAYTGDKSGYATTTHYYDGNKGACGCGTDSGAFPWQLGSGSLWTAAGSSSLFDNGGSSSWCGSGCGTCYELTNAGSIAASGQGDCTGAGEKITVLITNLCPAQGNEQWCSAPTNRYGFGAHFDINSQSGPASGWNNPVVKYRKIDCPSSLASNYQQCQCAGSSRVRRGLLQQSWVEGFEF